MLSGLEAKIGGLAEVMRCVEAARNYMRANGNPHQWTDGYPSEELLTNDIKNQQLYVCVGDDDKIHGVFAFIIGRGSDLCLYRKRRMAQ